jgi:hypothetical protein
VTDEDCQSSHGSPSSQKTKKKNFSDTQFETVFPPTAMPSNVFEMRSLPIQDRRFRNVRSFPDSNQDFLASSHQTESVDRDLEKVLKDLSSLCIRMKDERKATSQMNTMEIPPSFLCPITHDIMRDPYIVAETGHSYDRVSIVNWLVSNMTDPKTNHVLTSKTLLPNHTLRGAIDDFLDALHRRQGPADQIPPPATPRPHYIVRTWGLDMRLGRVVSTDAHLALDLPTAEVVCLTCCLVFPTHIHRLHSSLRPTVHLFPTTTSRSEPTPPLKTNPSRQRV